MPITVYAYNTVIYADLSLTQKNSTLPTAELQHYISALTDASIIEAPTQQTTYPACYSLAKD